MLTTTPQTSYEPLPAFYTTTIQQSKKKNTKSLILIKFNFDLENQTV